MKKLIYLFSITIALTIFTSVNASAQTLPSNTATITAPGVMCDFFTDWLNAIFGNSGNNNTSGNSTSGSTTSGSTNSGSTSGSTQLPINNGVVFLMIAGAAIGVVTLQRYKVAKTAVIQK